MITVQQAIRAIVEGKDLSEAQAREVVEQLMAGAASEPQIAALLIALRMKGETVPEIVGFVRGVRDGATRAVLHAQDAVDTCGTGGDGGDTFNVSTVAAIVAAGAGCKVAKHGNRSSSGRAGSADLLEALGVNIQMPPEKSAALIDSVGFGFLFAPQYHPGARHAARVRREIAIRTIFNTIGPLAHPAGAKRQLMGLFDGKLTEPVAEVLRQLGSTHCMVVHGEDGLDEITTTARTRVSELRDGRVQCYMVHPEDVGLPTARLADLRGGDAAENARIARSILAGEPGPKRDIVCMNAGAVAYVAGRAADLREGVRLAQESIDSGRAQAALDAIVAAGAEGDAA